MSIESDRNAIEPLAPALGSAAVLRLRNEVAVTAEKDSPLARDITLTCNLLSDAMNEMCAAYDLLPEGSIKDDFDRIIDKYWGPEPPNGGDM